MSSVIQQHSPLVKFADLSVAETLFISVVIPVRNEARFIENTLEQLLAQDYPADRFELIVVDGESTDGTPTLVAPFAERYINVKLLSNPKRLSSAARNIGIRIAKGDVIVIVDGHCELNDDQYLTKLADAFDRSAADCIGRPQPLDVTGATPLQRAIAAARSSRLGHHPASFVYSSQEQWVPAKSVAVAYHRSVFEKIGWFDETFDACEDVEFNHRLDRARLQCLFVPRIAVRYRPRSSLTDLFKQLVRYGRGRVRLLRKHSDTLDVKTLIPALFVLGAVLGAAMLPLSPWLAGCYLVGMSSYVAILSASSTVIAIGHRDVAILPWLPAVFLTIHTSCGVGLILEIANRSPRRSLASSAETVSVGRSGHPDRCVALPETIRTGEHA